MFIIPAVAQDDHFFLLVESSQLSVCVKCGKCRRVCPQNTDIPHALEELSEMLSQLPSWEEICKQREGEAKRKDFH